MIESGNMWITGTDLTADERLIRRAALHAILGGDAIDQGGLVSATGFPLDKVGVLLENLSKRGLIVIAHVSGRVVGSWGLSLVPTDHRLRIRGRNLYTWCAIDAVGIPAGLGEDGSIISRCHQCGVPLKVEMVCGKVSYVEPTEARVWMVSRQAGRSVVGFT